MSTDATIAFQKYYETWFEQLHLLNDELNHHLSVAASNKTLNLHMSDHHYKKRTHELVEKAMTHYSEYFETKCAAGEGDIFAIFSAPWASSLERSLHWVAGFRPTTIFHLIYTELSIRFESHMSNIFGGQVTGDLGELSPRQLERLSELQGETVKTENAISDQLGQWQDEVVGVDDLTFMMRPYSGDDDRGTQNMESLREVVDAADHLRMETMRKVVDFLTPQQAVEFMVAANELLFGIREWGLHQDQLRKMV